MIQGTMRKKTDESTIRMGTLTFFYETLTYLLDRKSAKE